MDKPENCLQNFCNSSCLKLIATAIWRVMGDLKVATKIQQNVNTFETGEDCKVMQSHAKLPTEFEELEDVGSTTLICFLVG